MLPQPQEHKTWLNTTAAPEPTARASWGKSRDMGEPAASMSSKHEPLSASKTWPVHQACWPSSISRVEMDGSQVHTDAPKPRNPREDDGNV